MSNCKLKASIHGAIVGVVQACTHVRGSYCMNQVAYELPVIFKHVKNENNAFLCPCF